MEQEAAMIRAIDQMDQLDGEPATSFPGRKRRQRASTPNLPGVKTIRDPRLVRAVRTYLRLERAEREAERKFGDIEHRCYRAYLRARELLGAYDHAVVVYRGKPISNTNPNLMGLGLDDAAEILVLEDGPLSD
jgi:hypothetical protein